MKHLNVLIACEESQAECMAFRKYGHNAFSCDLQKCRRGGNPEYHIRGDVTRLLQGGTQFYTQDGRHHHISRWHLIIAHPPCTYLCKVSSVHMVKDGHVNQERYAQLMQAREFFFRCLNADAPFVAVENPLPMARANLPKPSCFIQPFWFGAPYSKKTLYWTKNLPPLMAECEVINPKQYCHASRGKYRSRTFPEVADAIARQWGKWCTVELGINV
jgi:hypothetical protein